MSRRFRNRQAAASAVPLPPIDDVVGNQERLDLNSQYMTEPISTGTMLSYSQNYPVARERFHPMAAGYPVAPIPIASIKDQLDHNAGGEHGLVDDNVYSLSGPVTSDGVENFRLDGRQAIIRRGRNPSDRGDVRTADWNAQLAMAYAQQVNQYYPSEQSQYDLVRSV